MQAPPVVLDGPRERARLEGVRALGDGDLVALVLGTGTFGRPVSSLASEILAAAGGLVAMAREGPPDVAGLGDAKRARLEAAIEIGRRAVARAALESARAFSGPEAVAAWGHAELEGLAHEEIWALILDARHQLLAARRVAQGGAAGCATTARDILRVVLRAGGSAFVLVHNHPSGDPTPSVEDVRTTIDLARAAAVVGAPLLDHVVVGRAAHASLVELGLLDTDTR